MSQVRYARKAYADLRAIGVYTLTEWGIDQAEKYLDDLHENCLLIAEHPLIGRPCSPAHPKWMRLEYESHVILYSVTRLGVTVQRILHQRQLLS
ncbi:MAG: type II toxin-antitoxin system RelE/ParE family toxin [Acidobacteriota bacterium]